MAIFRDAGAVAGTSKRIATRIALAFLAFGVTWVLVTDILVHQLSPLPWMALWAETVKGWAFVALTAVLLYVVVERSVAGLQSEEAKIRAILNSIADGVLLLGPEGRIIDANAAAVRLLRVASAGELVGLGAEAFSERFRVSFPDGRLVPPGDYISQRVLRGEEVQPYKALVYPPDGHLLVVSVNAAPVRVRPGDPIEMGVSTFQDITSLEQFERLRDQLFAAVAHSLKTPVAIIQGHAQLLLAGRDARTARSASAIDRQCRRIDCLIQNLLVLARLRSGSLRLHPEEVDLAALVERALREEGPLPGGHRVVAQLAEHPRVRVDPERMALVVANLLEAAGSSARPGSDIVLTVTQDGGSAEVRTRFARLAGEEQQREASRRDEFSASVLEEIDEHTGLRVGRHVIEKIAEAHGGSSGAADLPGGERVKWVRVPVAGEDRVHASA